jgi:hypothetical protein
MSMLFNRRSPMRLPKTGVWIIAGALVFFMMNCWECGVNPPPTLRLNDTLTIAYHDTLFNLDENLWISFDSLLNDCRCPIHCYCYSTCLVSVGMTFSNNNDIKSFVVGTDHEIDNGDSGWDHDTTFLNYHFMLLNVSPYPGTAGSMPPLVPREQYVTKYKVKFLITK